MNQMPPEELPTAHVAQAVTVNLDITNEIATLVFQDDHAEKFAVTCKPHNLPAIFAMVSNLMAQWHNAKPEKGVFFHRVVEGLVSSSDELRGSILLSFDHGMGFMIENETALKLCQLIEAHVKRGMSEAEWKSYQQKKAPLIIQPRSRIITP